jgi:hypothetical protein
LPHIKSGFATIKIRDLPIARAMILCLNAIVECKSISFFTPPNERNDGNIVPLFFGPAETFFHLLRLNNQQSKKLLFIPYPSKTKRGTMPNTSFLFLLSSCAEKFFRYTHNEKPDRIFTSRLLKNTHLLCGSKAPSP